MLYHLRQGHVVNFLIHALEDSRLSAAFGFLHGKMVDIGCGHKPYEAMLRSYISQHVGVDLEDTRYDRSIVDLFGSATAIPAPDGLFDSALCTSTLEHVEEPEAALRECHRVLKKGGVAVYSVPLFWHLHDEPRDYYRFTKFGLRYLFEKTGFEIIALDEIGGFWVTFGQMFTYYLYRFNRPPLRWIGLIPGVSVLIQITALILNKLDRADRWACLYLVVARKKGAPEPGADGGA